jgi:hypothetical protein
MISLMPDDLAVARVRMHVPIFSRPAAQSRRIRSRVYIARAILLERLKRAGFRRLVYMRGNHHALLMYGFRIERRFFMRPAHVADHRHHRYEECDDRTGRRERQDHATGEKRRYARRREHQASQHKSEDGAPQSACPCRRCIAALRSLHLLQFVPVRDRGHDGDFFMCNTQYFELMNNTFGFRHGRQHSNDCSHHEPPLAEMHVLHQRKDIDDASTSVFDIKTARGFWAK